MHEISKCTTYSFGFNTLHTLFGQYKLKLRKYKQVLYHKTLPQFLDTKFNWDDAFKDLI